MEKATIRDKNNSAKILKNLYIIKAKKYPAYYARYDKI